MRGRDLTPAQVEANGKLGGQDQAFYIRQLNLLAENDLFDLDNERSLGPSSCRYSAECVEGKFSEVQMQHLA
jgi:hypothetical protein